MGTIKESAERFFNACEGGKGWAECSQYCHPNASFSAQADALAEVTGLDAYTDWIAGLAQPMPGNSFEIKAFSVDEERGCAMGFAVFRGAHTGEGGPIPPTGGATETEYVYVMQFDGDKIRHMTKVWNDSFCLKQLGWA